MRFITTRTPAAPPRRARPFGPLGAAAAALWVGAAGACGPAGVGADEGGQSVEGKAAVNPRGARDLCWKQCGENEACVAKCVRDEKEGLDPIDNRLKAYFSKDGTNDFFGNTARREAASRLQISASGLTAMQNCPAGSSGEGAGPPRGFPW